MTAFQIVELVVFAFLVVLHVVSNFYNARCTCKLCSLARSLFGDVHVEQVQSQASVDPDSELVATFVKWLRDQKGD